MRSAKYWLLAAFLTLPAFGLMLRPGIFSMHDPHLFRIQQFDLCAQAGVFPCRWSPDSSKGYGSPLFNFYAQAPYWFTQSFRIAGLSLLASAKAAYIFSLLASGLAMYLFARRLWGNPGGLISAVFYVYAPYRAVDIWVRGALPEALAFVWYPLILYWLDRYLEGKKFLSLALFSLSLALLLLTHNLSFLMFSPFVVLYWLWKVGRAGIVRTLPMLTLAGIFSLGLAAFYLLPVIFENGLVTLTDTVSGYYNFQIHFATLKELFVSRFWGYGASLWMQKYLSVSVGHLHWLIPLLLLPHAIVKFRKHPAANTGFLICFTLGLLALFLTHGKSLFIWQLVPPMKYIQFPWRFLSVAVFFLSVAVGYLTRIRRLSEYLPAVMVLVIGLNIGFFRPDVWQNITDTDVTSGRLWDEGRSSSLTDFWPKYGPPPDDFAPGRPWFSVGTGQVLSQTRNFTTSDYILRVDSPIARVVFPQVYFPGWVVLSSNRILPIDYSRSAGLISVALPAGTYRLTVKFVDTPVRRLGNCLSLVATAALAIGIIYRPRQKS